MDEHFRREYGTTASRTFRWQCSGPRPFSRNQPLFCFGVERWRICDNSLPGNQLRGSSLAFTEAARTLKVDLIVISTHGYTGVNRALLGSVTERVVREAPCPVLVVREHEHEFIVTREKKGVAL